MECFGSRKEKMTSWGAIFDATWWLLKGVYYNGYWMIWGTPQSIEMMAIKETEKRLNSMERRIDQLWAIQTGVVVIDPDEPGLGDSMVMIDPKQDPKQDEPKSSTPSTIHTPLSTLKKNQLEGKIPNKMKKK